MKQKYYRVRTSYDKDDAMIITDKELPIAVFAFLYDTDFVCSAGAVRGKNIIDILPDHCLSMGWNRGYKLTEYDWGDVRRELGKSLETEMENVKMLCQQSKGDKKQYVALLENYRANGNQLPSGSQMQGIGEVLKSLLQRNP